ncbi:BglG family transcription antiterminator LicT [Helcococcus sueciensis]|uniref:BglG family transcription antiterminator LicT n=1 Tax=Helcococcus sueciensis TaxID=241555 RepID=UPI000485B521|nr:PRD domain-containing protein [Helcococcus sueciensis]
MDANKKVLNNNFVIVGNNEEKILMGVGLGFGKKPGDNVDESKIMKIFDLSNPAINKNFMELINDIPIDVIEVSEKIISNIKLEMGEKINDIIYINIIDHINSSLKRYKEGIVITNNLLPEIERFYSKEFNLAKDAVKTINESFNVNLSFDEVGFIALHIVNATITESQDLFSYKITEMMKDVLNIVKRYFIIEFDENSLYYYRFITHLRFFGQRMFVYQSYENNNYDDLLEMIKEKYKNCFQCANLIKSYIEKIYNKQVTKEELLYLTIHIQRVIEESKKNNKGD